MVGLTCLGSIQILQSLIFPQEIKWPVDFVWTHSSSRNMKAFLTYFGSAFQHMTQRKKRCIIHVNPSESRQDLTLTTGGTFYLPTFRDGLGDEPNVSPRVLRNETSLSPPDVAVPPPFSNVLRRLGFPVLWFNERRQGWFCGPQKPNGLHLQNDGFGKCLHENMAIFVYLC